MGDGRLIARAALFVPPRFVPNNDLLDGLGCDLDDRGWVVTGANGATSVPGVRVAGNLANPRAQVITAAGEGSAAAIAIKRARRPRRLPRGTRLLQSRRLALNQGLLDPGPQSSRT
ncbi:MAG TPA: hypothetical protein VF635_09305 [Propionibacteriaceae bacterium]|jgi:thioredoxin reductase